MLSTHEQGPFSYAYPHHAVATDIAIFTLSEERLAVLLIERGQDPFQGCWALPGGFLKPTEDLDTCAHRELFEETGVGAPLLRHFGNFSALNRDPRERVISVAYLALVRFDEVVLRAGTDASTAKWFGIADRPPLVFDHEMIVNAAIASLQAWIEHDDILLNLLPEKFTLSQAQAAYEAISGEPIDKRNFRAKILATGLLRETDDMERGAHRPARIYTRAQKGSPGLAGRPSDGPRLATRPRSN